MLKKICNRYFVLIYLQLPYQDCFANELKGVHVSEHFAKVLCTTSGDDRQISIEQPLLGTNTTENDFKEAKYVFRCYKSSCCCSRKHLTECQIQSSEDIDTLPLPKNDTVERHSINGCSYGSITDANKISQEQIKDSVDRSEKEQLKYTRFTEEEKCDYRKNILTRIEESYNDTRASAHELYEL